MTTAAAVLERLKRAAIVVADVLDAGERDPTWHESQELEEAAIAYGRAVRASLRPAQNGLGGALETKTALE